MSAIPTEFTHAPFPEISGTQDQLGTTFVFFDSFDFPTAEQTAIVDRLQGWSLIRWGGWSEDLEVEEVDFEAVEGYAEEESSVEDCDVEAALQNLALDADGLSNGEREPQPIEQNDDLEQLYPEGEDWGVVAVNTDGWQTVSTLQWQGCINVAEPHEMAVALKKWHERWGVEVLAFGAEEDSDTLLLRVPERSKDDQEMLNTLATAADQVDVYNHPDLGQLLSLWFD